MKSLWNKYSEPIMSIIGIISISIIVYFIMISALTTSEKIVAAIAVLGLLFQVINQNTKIIQLDKDGETRQLENNEKMEKLAKLEGISDIVRSLKNKNEALERIFGSIDINSSKLTDIKSTWDKLVELSSESASSQELISNYLGSMAISQQLKRQLYFTRSGFVNLEKSGNWV